MLAATFRPILLASRFSFYSSIIRPKSRDCFLKLNTLNVYKHFEKLHIIQPKGWYIIPLIIKRNIKFCVSN